MNKFLLIFFLLLFFSTTGIAQPQPDSVCFSYEEVQNMANNVKTLQKNLDLEKQENEKLNQIIMEYETVLRQDSLIMRYRERQIELFNEEIALYKRKNSFWKSETWGFIEGVGLVVISSFVLSNIK